MPSSINASNSGSGGIVQTADASGVLQLQTAGTTALTIDTSQNIGIGTTSPDDITSGYTTVDVRGSTGGGLRLGVASGNNMAIYASATTSVIEASGSSVLQFVTNAAERMRLDASGRLGVGRTSVGAQFDVLGAASTSAMRVVGNSGASVYVDLSGGGDNYYDATNNIFRNASGTERARIDSSGNFLVNTTSATSGGSTCKQVTYISNFGTTAGISVQGGTNNAGTFFQTVNYAGTINGSITQVNASTIAFNTTSDYRLKENIAPMTGALAKVAQLKPVTYTWKLDGASGEGFIAHELKAVIPDAVTGEKDAVNEDGSIKPQSIDVSFLVATLTAAIKEQQALIESLTQRITALEGA